MSISKNYSNISNLIRYSIELLSDYLHKLNTPNIDLIKSFLIHSILVIVLYAVLTVLSSRYYLVEHILLKFRLNFLGN